MEIIKKQRHFDGWVQFGKHSSQLTKGEMKFSCFIPDHEPGEKLLSLFWLSGLTCTEENFITKSGFGALASKLKVALFCPDTSPRGSEHPGEHESYDFGSGAGFYLDATESPWSENYKMYSYVTEEFFNLVSQFFPVDLDRLGIFGHSMGGHGALSIAIKNPEKFKSVSAFSPIVSPVNCPWGVKAFTGYLGEDKESWKQYDSTELLKNLGYQGKILIHQGLADEFLKEQLKPELLEQAAQNISGLELQVEKVADYDHSYFFISSFIDKHLRFHTDCMSRQ